MTYRVVISQPKAPNHPPKWVVFYILISYFNIIFYKLFFSKQTNLDHQESLIPQIINKRAKTGQNRSLRPPQFNAYNVQFFFFKKCNLGIIELTKHMARTGCHSTDAFCEFVRRQLGLIKLTLPPVTPCPSSSHPPATLVVGDQLIKEISFYLGPPAHPFLIN